MSNPITLKAEPRKTATRGGLRSMRRSGKVPGVVYGKGVERSTPVAVDEKVLQALLRSHPHALLELDVPGIGKQPVLMTGIQRDSVTREILHIDFHKINMNEKITAPVRLETSGKSAGEKEGGLLQFVLHEIEVECLPADLPETIVMDVSGLQLGDNLTVADLKLPEGVKATLDPETVLVAVLAPQKGVEEEADEAAEAPETAETTGKA